MAITPGIYPIDGQFGSGKTLIMARYIAILHKDPRVIIITNIKLHFSAPNIMNIDDMINLGEYDKFGKEKTKHAFLDVLQYIGIQDDQVRKLKISRYDRLKWFLFLDEGGILLNQHNRKQFPYGAYDYLLQVRKINVYLFLGVQKFKNLTLQIREHTSSVLYFRPFLGLRFMKNYFGAIRMKQVDDEGVTEVRRYRAKDDKGDYVTKEEPIDWLVEYIRKPARYKYYDDLYLNKKFASVQLQLDYSPIQPHIDNYLGKKTPKEIPFTKKKILDLKEQEILSE